jgi:hypothetical protein
MPYDSTQGYMKFQKKNCCGDESCDGNCDKCKECEDECSCCPPGLVAIYNDQGVHVGCVTPNDAELYQKNTFTCKDGYVKLFRNADGAFLGCVSETEFATLYPIINP